jgi:hypothetical protein
MYLSLERLWCFLKCWEEFLSVIWGHKQQNLKKKFQKCKIFEERRDCDAIFQEQFANEIMLL